MEAIEENSKKKYGASVKFEGDVHTFQIGMAEPQILEKVFEKLCVNNICKF